MSAFTPAAASLLRLWRRRRALGRLGRQKARRGARSAKWTAAVTKAKYLGPGTRGNRIRSRVAWYYRNKKRQYGGAVGLGGAAGGFAGYKVGRRDRGY